MESLVTIIVPVYQAEKYVAYCIESILAQDYNHWELILINDGSTDCSGDLCDAYAMIDPRIHVYHQTNQGVSVARNKGLQKAKGDYLLFVDADDCLEKIALETLVKIAQNNELPILQFGIRSYQNGSKAKVATPDSFKLTIYNDLNQYHTFQYGVWGYLLRRDIYTQENFTEGIKYAEDIEYITKCITHSNKIGILSATFYYLRLHPQSAMANLHSYQQVADHLVAIRNLSQYTADKSEQTSRFINQQITKLVKSYFSFFIKNQPKKKEISQINKDYRSIYPLINTQSWKDRIAFSMAYLDIRIYIALLRIYVTQTSH